MNAPAHKVVIGMGSNINPAQNIQAAIDRIALDHAVLGIATWEWTKPIGRADQDDFINTAVYIATGFNRDQLAGYLRSIENELGRVRTSDKFAPRTIDLDIVVWDGCVVDDDFYKRDFLKRQVLELVKDLVY
ncbi:MAG: 2-amino-4-hydroxy-6-hydroxymethyldihydropteridine diphosphokinase [Candidatus Auribacterota bacterium]|jgi:2-amino-4-hydroxy-6-hydroxymethyldihydropteridine diphosphokinase|nr:2-amino-4-hydroxy-6-hydroxymethyldihydropteridine diphosphokinase [Candidatus Auribacterota bacterium]